ncbi:MAG: aspartate/glutamate racemase family protein [Burkholderiales bacterium]|nr:aspartate/glutamate racemase family protein [Burkholderiales bacterium]
MPPVEAAPGAGFLGVLMLDTRFPRPPGDIGHPASFAMPVRHAVVPGAWPSKVVASARSLRASGLAQAFREQARELEREGAGAITTSCGFLVLLQRELQEAVTVPVVTSSLLQLPSLLARERQVGVLTISAAHLGHEHLLAAGVEPARLGDVIVQGVDPAGEFAQANLGNRDAMDLARAQEDVVSAALALKSRAPDLGSVVLECTNMPPYAQAVRDATGWRLFSLLDAFGRVT